MSEAAEESLSAQELREAWPILSREDRLEGLRLLPRDTAEDLFFDLPSTEQAEVVLGLPASERRSWIRLLPPDDAADLIQAAPAHERDGLLQLLDEATRKDVTALLAYEEDRAGGLMHPRFARLRPDMTVEEAITYLRAQPRATLATLYYAYVLDQEQRLLGVVAVHELLAAPRGARVRDAMKTDVVTVGEDLDQEAVSRIFRKSGLIAIPVIDAQRHMKGVVTVDDVVEVVSEEATEDIQKIGGSEALGEPYLTIRFSRMLKKRAGWLSALFLGEMLTANAMGFFENAIDRAVLGSIGFLRIEIWQKFLHPYGEHHVLVALTVFFSLIGVVTFGTLAGSLLPFLLRRLRFDPASASAPFVAALVDVTGLIIYFTTASLILRGTLL